jgi:hypothetical protein
MIFSRRLFFFASKWSKAPKNMNLNIAPHDPVSYLKASGNKAYFFPNVFQVGWTMEEEKAKKHDFV